MLEAFNTMAFKREEEDGILRIAEVRKSGKDMIHSPLNKAQAYLNVTLWPRFCTADCYSGSSTGTFSCWAPRRQLATACLWLKPPLPARLRRVTGASSLLRVSGRRIRSPARCDVSPAPAHYGVSLACWEINVAFAGSSSTCHRRQLATACLWLRTYLPAR